MFGYRENERKWRKIENYIERRNLESSTIRKYPKVFFNESITFLFIGQGQVDTWHHLRGLPEAYSSRNLEKIHFGTSPQQFRMMMQSGKSISCIFVLLERFAWLCENFAWSCETTFHFPCVLQPSLFCFISHDYAKISHGHAKLKNMLFRLLFAISPISFSWFHFNYLQINSKCRSKPIALLLSLCIWIIINFILQFDSSLLSPIYQNHTLKWLQNFIKLVSNSCKGKNMLIECFRHNYYSKDVKLMRIII